MFMIYSHDILKYYISDEIMRMCRAWQWNLGTIGT